MAIHDNYEEFEKNHKAMAKHVDNMFNLIYKYGRKHNIPLRGDDRAERVVEAIATYIVESRI